MSYIKVKNIRWRFTNGFCVKNGFKVLDRCYFVHCQVNKASGFHHGNLIFDIKVQPYDGDDSWDEDKIYEAKK